MSIPGFVAAPTPTAHDEVVLPCGAEWRFEVPFKTLLKVNVLEGVGEVFGTELPNQTDIVLTGAKGAVYAPLPAGCKLQYATAVNRDNVNISNEDGHVSEYVSDELAAKVYANLHFALEVMRQQAVADPAARGPKVLILGNRQVGKTAMAKTLVAYACKNNRVPLLVNLDPRTGVFSVPGLLTATPISDSLDLESVSGWGGTTTLGLLAHNPKQPLVKTFGFETLAENGDLYKYQVLQLGVAALLRMRQDDAVRAGGMVIDTPALAIHNFDVIEAVVLDFDVDIVVVVGNDKLAVDLGKRFSHRVDKGALNIVKLPKAGGAVEPDEAFVRKVQEDTIKEYFNGNFRTPLSPYKLDVDLAQVTIFKVVRLAEYTSLLAFLPAGDLYTLEEKKDLLDKYYTRMEEPTSLNLENSILAITHVPVTATGKVVPRDLLNSSVMGYAHVSKVDDAKKRMSLLLPFPGTLPRNVLVATNIGYTE